MRIAFAGTPAFAEKQLKALLNSKHDIVVVYTQPDKPAGRGQQLHESPVKQLARLHGIPVEQPPSLKPAEALAAFQQYAPDVFIVAAYGLLLPTPILETPPLGCINIHASLLPRWRGASPIQQAILAGDLESGITLMQMDEGLDTGDMLAVASTPITARDTAATLHDKLADLGAQLLLKHIDHIATLTPIPQDNSQATHAHKITKAQGKIDWHQSAASIERQIRALNPWPMSSCQIGDLSLRIWDAKVVPLEKSAKIPGTVMAFHEDCPVISTGDGTGLCLLIGQMPGKKAMSFSALLRGHPTLLTPGHVLNDNA